MKKSELRKIIKEEISEMNFTGHGYDRDDEENEFTRNTPARIGQFLDKLEDLVDEYHAELYLKDGVYKYGRNEKCSFRSRHIKRWR
jgi:hypothetical protein